MAKLFGEEDDYSDQYCALLKHLVAINQDNVRCCWDRTNPFTLTRPPPISLADYTRRLVDYMRCPPSAFVVASAYLISLAKASPWVFSDISALRIMGTVITVATKWIDDQCYSNVYYAGVVGLSVEKLFAGEVSLMQHLNGQLFISLATYETTKKILRSSISSIPASIVSPNTKKGFTDSNTFDNWDSLPCETDSINITSFPIPDYSPVSPLGSPMDTDTILLMVAASEQPTYRSISPLKRKHSHHDGDAEQMPAPSRRKRGTERGYGKTPGAPKRMLAKGPTEDGDMVGLELL